ncbi:hypothetical protein JXA02_08200 [candidate division KSB1 bacterium]|nr:hypothetical protein [candidate division KSB1 bacterium]RQW05692.1 MAG: hypothetical protein EH222_09680 [candidate division KSB1 bacterium]
MKKLLTCCIMVSCICLPTALAQSDSARGSSSSANLLEEPVQHAIYGAAMMKFSPVGPQGVNSLFVGGELYWLLNKKYLLGLGFTGLSTVVQAPAIFPVEGLVLVTNYGGLVLGYVHNSHKLIHLEAVCLGGIGQAFYRDKEYAATYNQNDTYIILEPAVSAVLNMTSAFRIGAGLSYRLAQKVDLIGLDDRDLSGLSLNLSFRVGRF